MYRVLFLFLFTFSHMHLHAQDLPTDIEDEAEFIEEDEDFLQPIDLTSEDEEDEEELQDFDPTNFEGSEENIVVEEDEEEGYGPPAGDGLDSDFAEDDTEMSASSDEDLGELPSSLVVEQEYIAVRRTEHVEDAIPLYKDRRDRWGTMFSVSYGTYAPDSYSPVDGGTFDSLYGTSGSVQLTILRKLNFEVGAVVFGGGAGVYSATASSGASLTVIPIRAEAGIVLDTLFNEPILAPYVVGGVILNQYDETGTTQDASGNTRGQADVTGMAPYFAGGVNFQLDWLDRESALATYLDYGLENTFLFLEARSYLASVGAGDPDFSNGMHFAGGLRLEF